MDHFGSKDSSVPDRVTPPGQLTHDSKHLDVRGPVVVGESLGGSRRKALMCFAGNFANQGVESGKFAAVERCLRGAARRRAASQLPEGEIDGSLGDAPGGGK